MKTINASKIPLLALAGALAFASCNALAADAVTKVNGVTIPQSRVDFLVKVNASRGQPDTPEIRNQIRDLLIRNEIIAQEAVKKGLDKTPDVTTQLEISKQEVLLNAYVQDYFKANPVSEETLKKEYDAAKAQAGDKEYKARHILVKDEAEAKQIIAQLKKKVSFEKLAAQKSIDPGTKGKGGDLGWLSPGPNLAKPFGDALSKLKKGQLTDAPVQTQFGWHVILLDDERPTKIPAFEEAKNNIQQQLQNQAMQKVIADLRAKAKIE